MGQNWCYPCSSHQNSWDLWAFIGSKKNMVLIPVFSCISIPMLRTCWNATHVLFLTAEFTYGSKLIQSTINHSIRLQFKISTWRFPIRGDTPSSHPFIAVGFSMKTILASRMGMPHLLYRTPPHPTVYRDTSGDPKIWASCSEAMKIQHAADSEHFGFI